MPPVTLKNKYLHDTLYLAQGLITLSTAVVIWLSFTQNHFLALPLPVLVWGFIRNRKTIQKNKQFNIVMNAECEWRLVNVLDSKVTEATLKTYWVTPVFLMFQLQNKNQNFYCLVIRKKVDESAYSRLLQGVQKQSVD